MTGGRGRWPIHRDIPHLESMTEQSSLPVWREWIWVVQKVAVAGVQFMCSLDDSEAYKVLRTNLLPAKPSSFSICLSAWELSLATGPFQAQSDYKCQGINVPQRQPPSNSRWELVRCAVLSLRFSAGWAPKASSSNPLNCTLFITFYPFCPPSHSIPVLPSLFPHKLYAPNPNLKESQLRQLVNGQQILVFLLFMLKGFILAHLWFRNKDKLITFQMLPNSKPQWVLERLKEQRRMSFWKQMRWDLI